MRRLAGFLCEIHGWVPGFGIVELKNATKVMCKKCSKVIENGNTF